jgi:hypothetical protein
LDALALKWCVQERPRRGPSGGNQASLPRGCPDTFFAPLAGSDLVCRWCIVRGLLDEDGVSDDSQAQRLRQQIRGRVVRHHRLAHRGLRHPCLSISVPGSVRWRGLSSIFPIPAKYSLVALTKATIETLPAPSDRSSSPRESTLFASAARRTTSRRSSKSRFLRVVFSMRSELFFPDAVADPATGHPESHAWISQSRP